MFIFASSMGRDILLNRTPFFSCNSISFSLPDGQKSNQALLTTVPNTAKGSKDSLKSGRTLICLGKIKYFNHDIVDVSNSTIFLRVINNKSPLPCLI